MKVRTDMKQEAVQTQIINGTDYIRLYLHETEGTENSQMEDTPHTYYEYDFKEIIVPTGTLNIEAVKKNPEDYLNYQPTKPTTLEDLQEALMALQQVVLGGIS